MVQVHDKFFIGRIAFQKSCQFSPFDFHVDWCQIFQRRYFRTGSDGIFPVGAEGTLVNPVIRETERQTSELAQQKILEGFVTITIGIKALLLDFFRKVFFFGFSNRFEHGKKLLDGWQATTLVCPGHGQKSGIPCRLRTRCHIVVANDLARIGQKVEHIRKQLDITLLDSTFLRRRSCTTRHGVTDNVMVNALEIRRAVTVEIWHELLANEIGIAQRFPVEAGLKTQFIFHISGQRTDIALTIAANRSAETGIDDLATCFRSSCTSRQEQAIGDMAMVMQNQFRPAFSECRDQFTHEFRRTNASHILQAQNKFTGNRFFRQA